MKPLQTPQAVPFPSESKLSPSYRSAYFVDAFAVRLPSRRYTAHQVALAFWEDLPVWFMVLLWTRDRIVSAFGVKPSSEIKSKAVDKGIETISAFPVVLKDEREVIIGEDDKHLDFRTSILIRDSAHEPGQSVGQEVVATTVVHTHGLFGKVYITFIRVFHVLIVKWSLARVPDRLSRKDSEKSGSH